MLRVVIAEILIPIDQAVFTQRRRAEQNHIIAFACFKAAIAQCLGTAPPIGANRGLVVAIAKVDDALTRSISSAKAINS